MINDVLVAVMPNALIKRWLKPIFRGLRAAFNAGHFRRIYYGAQLRSIRPTLLRTGEMSNFTYDLTARNLRVLAETIAVATQRPAVEIATYIEEVISDRDLREFFEARMQSWDGARTSVGVKSPFGRRLGWYAVARATKPKVIVETEVDRGRDE